MRLLSLTILLALFSCVAFAETIPDVPKIWIPPHLSKDVQIITINRNLDLEMGSGSFRIPTSSIKTLLNSGYHKASLKPDGELFRKTKDGSVAYGLRLGDASWIIIHKVLSRHTIDGIEYAEFEFWTDSKLYEN